MKNNSIEILEKLVHDNKMELIGVEERINSTMRELKEYDSYITKLSKSDDEFAFLSPRSGVDAGAEVQKKITERAKLKEKYALLLKQEDTLNDTIKKLTIVLREEREKSLALSIEDRDKKRAARLLHDKSMEKILYLINEIKECSQDVTAEPYKVKVQLDMVCNALSHTVDDMHDIAFDLHPSSFGHVSLHDFFDKKIELLATTKKFDFDTLIEDVSCETISTVISIYHIMNELLLNIEKHAKAKNIKFFAVNRDGQYVIDITDDGVGFNFKEENFKEGLTMMRDRIDILGGTFTPNSILNCGTSIHIEIPLN